MSTAVLANPPVAESQSRRLGFEADWRELLARRQWDCAGLALGLACVPMSIAIAETFLSLALLVRIVRLLRGEVRLQLPRVFWLWLVWAGLETLLWAFSPGREAGWSEIRHLLLIAAMFVAVPALDRDADRRVVWQGILLTSTLSALFLIGDFAVRLVQYRPEISVTADPSLYLRTGGLLNNWMVYGTVEVMIVGGLISFWHFYPELRRSWWPVIAVHSVAIVLSLTRMTWVTCFVLLAVYLIWHRRRWIWILPVLPVAAYLLAPAVVRARIHESLRPGHYSNLERVQMLRVGWQMVSEHPLTGVGPGQVNNLYRSYLRPDDPKPAWHGHLHNNLAQLAAEFGLVVVAVALVFVAALFTRLVKACKLAANRESRFVALTALLAFVGFLVAGLFEYTYGHSLGLILLCFAVLGPLSFRRPRSEQAAS